MKNNTGFIFVILFSFNLFASSTTCKKVLEELNNTVVNIISSGRDEKIVDKLKDDTIVLSQTAHKLGFNIPDHNLLFASSEVLSQLVGVGGYAAPFWQHGLRVLQASKTLAGVMEFVVNGTNNSHAFYKDTTKYIHQLSIIMHVIGHNDFANTSIYATSRGGDGIAATYEISKLMQELYEKYDHDSVSLYFQALQSFWQFQDMVSGSHEPREHFITRARENEELFLVNRETNEVEDIFGKKRTASLPAGKVIKNNLPLPTSSMLQAMVSNLPKDTDKWKIKLAELFEENYRSQPELNATQVVNEGWATFSMYLIAKHSEWNSTKDQIDFAGLMSGVAVPSLTNPYWLGLECFWNLYWNFRKRPEISKLDDFEQDRKFVEYAHDIIKTHSSYQFIRKSLDKKWVERRKLQLMRDATPEEVEQAGRDPQKPHYVILSRNHERIIDYIARKAADRSEKRVRIFLNDLNYKNQGVLIKQDENVKLPVEKMNTAQTLFLLARYFMKPVSFDAYFVKNDIVKTLKIKPEFKKTLRGVATRTKAKKKAIIEAKEGQKIDLFEEKKEKKGKVKK